MITELRQGRAKTQGRIEVGEGFLISAARYTAVAMTLPASTFAGYAIGYATAPSPTGPFTKKTAAAPWVGSSAGSSGPGGLDTFVGPAGELWAAWHAWPGEVGYAVGGTRTTRVGTLHL